MIEFLNLINKLLNEETTIRKLHELVKDITKDEFCNKQVVDEIVDTRCYKLNSSYDNILFEINLYLDVIKYNGLDTIVKPRVLYLFLY